MMLAMWVSTVRSVSHNLRAIPTFAMGSFGFGTLIWFTTGLSQAAQMLLIGALAVPLWRRAAG